MVSDFIVYFKIIYFKARCQPPAVSTPNPDDPTGSPICADWQTGDFGPVMTVVCSQYFNVSPTVMYLMYVHVVH